MPWHIGQQVTPTNDITYIIEERLDTVYLFEKRRNPSTLYKATELSKDKSGVVKNVTVFIMTKISQHKMIRIDHMRMSLIGSIKFC